MVKQHHRKRDDAPLEKGDEAMAEVFKIGDTVRLKSGGPNMTVCHVEGENADCEWFANNKRKFGTFVIATLEHYSHFKTSNHCLMF